MADLQARLSPDGFVAQRFPFSFNNRGHWLVISAVDGRITWTVLDDADVQDWPALAAAGGSAQTSDQAQLDALREDVHTALIDGGQQCGALCDDVSEHLIDRGWRRLD